MCPLLLSRTPSDADLSRPVHAAHMCIDLVALENLVSLVSSIPSGFYTVSVSYSAGPLNPEGRDLMETFNLGPCVPRSLTLCIFPDCGYLYLFLLL